MTSPGRVCGVVLAGGRGTRMGGVDKGFVEVAGRPMIEYVIEALVPQVDVLLVSANRNQERYARYGHPVIGDDAQGFQGPLAGMASALRRADAEYLVTVPCDSPLVPPDLVERLRARLDEAGAEICCAHGGGRMQPVFCLLRTDLAPSLDAFLAGGGRKIDAWFAGHRTVTADFSDRPDAFLNVNAPEDVRAMEAELAARAGAAGQH